MTQLANLFYATQEETDMAQKVPRLQSSVFEIEERVFAGVTEQIVRGGRHLFPLLPGAFRTIQQIGVIGYKSQGRAQSLDLRDSLEGTGIKVKVGLRVNSERIPVANADGFTVENGTLGEMYQVIRESDFVILLIEDAAQVENYKAIFAAMKPGATLGFSHGFLRGYMDTVGEKFPTNINVVGVFPKGMGDSVRRLYEQGRDINGAGINDSIAVEQDLDGRATDIAIGWAIAIGAPMITVTTLLNEMLSDLFGERGVLLGGVRGMLQALYRFWIMERGETDDQAFVFSVEALTGSISPAISKRGLLGLYQQFSEDDRVLFLQAYSAAYRPYKAVLDKIYDEVECGNEIRRVVLAGARKKRYEGTPMERYSMSEIEGTPMWVTGARVRDLLPRPIGLGTPQAITAGLYVAMFMAQIDVLLERGHPFTEVGNEGPIEATDSLIPFMHKRGLSHMADNCSMTARRGDRDWAPLFDYATMLQVLPAFDADTPADPELVEAFLNHPIHEALDECRLMKPPVDIAVV